MLRSLPLFLAVAVAATAARAEPPARPDLAAFAGQYAVGDGSSVGFSIASALGPAVHARFDSFSGDFRIDAADVARSVVNFTVSPASVHTGLPPLDALLRSSIVFDADHSPVIDFRSTAVRRSGPASADVDGLLTLRGHSEPEHFRVDFAGGGDGSASFHVTGNVLRSAFGMTVGRPVFSDVVAFNLMIDGRRAAKKIARAG